MRRVRPASPTVASRGDLEWRPAAIAMLLLGGCTCNQDVVPRKSSSDIDEAVAIAKPPLGPREADGKDGSHQKAGFTVTDAAKQRARRYGDALRLYRQAVSAVNPALSGVYARCEDADVCTVHGRCAGYLGDACEKADEQIQCRSTDQRSTGAPVAAGFCERPVET